jgi:amino acid transporter
VGARPRPRSDVRVPTTTRSRSLSATPEAASSRQASGRALGPSGTEYMGPFGKPMPTAVFYGLAIASVGGPLALVTVFLPNTLAGLGSWSGVAVVLGAVAFVCPVIAWYRYARRVASPGGLFSYVETAAGTNVARTHGAIWAVSYFLYLPSTVVYVLYDILPTAFPGITPYRAPLVVAIPVVMVLALTMWRLGLFTLTAALGAVQVVLVGVLAGMEIAHTGSPAAAAVPAVTATSLAKSSAAVSLLFVCASLPLYLGAEVRRPTVTTARSLPFSVGLATVCALVGVVALTQFPARFLGAEVPGWLIALSVGGRTLGQVIVAGTAVSILTLVLLEYVALTRLLNVMVRARPRRAELGVGALFVGAGALSLLDPSAAYEKLLTPSLVALYLSQLVVFGVYPRFRHREGRLRAADIFVAIAASALMLYGLYSVLKPGTGL